MLWRLKSCPRCSNGDLLIDSDSEGWYESCLQCGYRRKLIKIEIVPAKQKKINDTKVEELK